MNEPTIAEQILKLWGASVEALPTSSEEECDWLATLGGCRLLIEEKLKLDNPGELLAQEASFQKGEAHLISTKLIGNNRLSGIVRKATAQLSSTGPKINHDLRVIWFTAGGINAESKRDQFTATLYGSTQIVEVENKRFGPCYFYRNSDFFRYRDTLDGAIVGSLCGEQVTNYLCLNPYSPTWEQLRDSPFASKFPYGLINPVEEEKNGQAKIVDSDVNRNNPDEVLRYLEAKYKCGRLVNMDMNMASALFVLPNHEL